MVRYSDPTTNAAAGCSCEGSGVRRGRFPGREQRCSSSERCLCLPGCRRRLRGAALAEGRWGCGWRRNDHAEHRSSRGGRGMAKLTKLAVLRVFNGRKNSL